MHDVGNRSVVKSAAIVGEMSRNFTVTGECQWSLLQVTTEQCQHCCAAL